MRCSSRCGTTRTSTTSRSPSPRRWASAGAAPITTILAPMRDMVQDRDVAAPLSGGHGAAGFVRGRCAARREAQSAEVADVDQRKQRLGAGRCAANIAPVSPRARRPPSYLEDIEEGSERHGELRGAEGRHRQLAMGRRAVLSSHRQASAAAVLRDRRRLQRVPHAIFEKPAPTAFPPTGS